MIVRLKKPIRSSNEASVYQKGVEASVYQKGVKASVYQQAVEMSSRHQVAIWRSVVYHGFLQALHIVPAQTVFWPSEFLLTTIIYAYVCLCVAWYMHMGALFTMAACVIEHSANGSIGCYRHTSSTLSLPIAPGTCHLSKWQNHQ